MRRAPRCGCSAWAIAGVGTWCIRRRRSHPRTPPACANPRFQTLVRSHVEAAVERDAAAKLADFTEAPLSAATRKRASANFHDSNARVCTRINAERSIRGRATAAPSPNAAAAITPPNLRFERVDGKTCTMRSSPLKWIARGRPFHAGPRTTSHPGAVGKGLQRSQSRGRAIHCRSLRPRR